MYEPSRQREKSNCSYNALELRKAESCTKDREESSARVEDPVERRKGTGPASLTSTTGGRKGAVRRCCTGEQRNTCITRISRRGREGLDKIIT